MSACLPPWATRIHGTSHNWTTVDRSWLIRSRGIDLLTHPSALTIPTLRSKYCPGRESRYTASDSPSMHIRLRLLTPDPTFSRSDSCFRLAYNDCNRAFRGSRYEFPTELGTADMGCLDGPAIGRFSVGPPISSNRSSSSYSSGSGMAIERYWDRV